MNKEACIGHLELLCKIFKTRQISIILFIFQLRVLLLPGPKEEEGDITHKGDLIEPYVVKIGSLLEIR